MVIASNDRGYWLVYAAWDATKVGYEHLGVRSLRIDPVVFVGGLPIIEGPTSVAVPVPSRR
jgi:hypothetical protein